MAHFPTKPIGSAIADLSIGDAILHDGRWHQVEHVDHVTLHPIGLAPRPICHFVSVEPSTGFGYSGTATDAWPAARFIMRSRREAA